VCKVYYTKSVNLSDLKKELQKKADLSHAEILQKFFKTGPGEYGEGDVFIGIKVPELRKSAETHQGLYLKDIEKLLRSRIHEERMVALFILRIQYEKAFKEEENVLPYINLYLNNATRINNWDLVDTSAPYILGHYLLKEDREVLYTFAKSPNLWKKRIAIISTFAFIKEKKFKDTLKIAELLLHEKHDLMHKAVGWMLREIGNRNLATEERFLKKHYQDMPRTMLRYAIEKFPEKRRKEYLLGKV
jgi:3-methyladenine DNA glycosylase AlkD